MKMEMHFLPKVSRKKKTVEKGKKSAETIFPMRQRLSN